MANRWEKIIDEAVQGPSATFNPNGYVVTAFQAALAAIIETPIPAQDPSRHLADSLETAVRIGDDCDTVAAIAGSFLGARWGAEAIPEPWRALIHGSRQNLSPTLQFSDLTDLVERAMQ